MLKTVYPRFASYCEYRISSNIINNTNTNNNDTNTTTTTTNNNNK